jgi:hypothetical protein
MLKELKVLKSAKNRHTWRKKNDPFLPVLNGGLCFITTVVTESKPTSPSSQTVLCRVSKKSRFIIALVSVDAKLSMSTAELSGFSRLSEEEPQEKTGELAPRFQLTIAP